MARKLGLGAALALSAAVHGGLFGGAAATIEIQRWQRGRELERAKQAQTEEQERKAELIRMKRELLVKQARAAIMGGRLSLGEFILQANEIDAEEEGKNPELPGARAKHREYLGRLVELLAAGVSVQEAVPRVLAGLDYYGAGAGSMTELLLEGGGACEQLSHLVASVVYDAGRKEQIYLRHYSGHLAPIFIENGREYDLVAGNYAYPGGVIFHATQLVEMYARAHGIRTEYEVAGENGGAVAEARREAGQDWIPEGKPSGFAYPPTSDSYPGSVPLFSRNAVKEFNPHEIEEGAAPEPETIGCGYRLEMLNPVAAWANTMGPGVMGTKLLEPDVYWLESIVECIESRKVFIEKTDGYMRLLLLGELTALYRETELQLKMLGKEELAREARTLMEKAADEANGIIESEDLLGEGLSKFYNAALEGNGGQRDLLGLHQIVFIGQKGEEILLRMLEKRMLGPIDEGQAFMVLCTNPGTVERAFGIMRDLSKTRQTELIAMLSNMTQDFVVDEDGSEQYRAYAAYRNIKARYRPASRYAAAERWCCEAPKFSELLVNVRQEIAANGLGEEWAIAFMAYYGRGAVERMGIFTPVFGVDGKEAELGLQFARELKAWLDGMRSNDPNIEALRRQVNYICSQNTFTPEVIIEAGKLRGDL